MQGDSGGQARVGQGAGSNRRIVQFHIMRGVLASEAHGVNGNVTRTQRVDGIRTDASGVVIAVAEQHHGADRQVGRFLAQLLEAIADASGGRAGRQVFEAVDAGGHGVHAVEARLKRAVEAGQNAVLERLNGFSLARGAILRYGHAA